MNKEDVAVVGGGSTGSSVAYHLAKAGHRVTLLEMDQIRLGYDEQVLGECEDPL